MSKKRKKKLKALLRAVARAVRRYLSNTPANAYEELVFSSVRSAVTIYGGRRLAV